MGISDYDNGIKYEALQEVITQLIARLSFNLHKQTQDDQLTINHVISNLVTYKKNITPDNLILYKEANRYIQETLKKWNLSAQTD